MGQEGIDYPTVIADLEAKKVALEGLIASFRSALALGALGQIGEVPPAAVSAFTPPSPGVPAELPAGAFHGKSLAASIKLYLAAVKKKQTLREIVTALRDGGVESTSDNFEGVLTGALNRLKYGGEVLRFKDGWGLAEFYPESLRSRIGTVTKQSKSKKRRAGKAKQRARVEVAAGTEVRAVGPQKSVEEYLATQRGKRITASEVADALQIRTQTVSLILGKLAHAGGLYKNADGSFDVGDPGDARLVN